MSQLKNQLKKIIPRLSREANQLKDTPQPLTFVHQAHSLIWPGLARGPGTATA